MKPYIIKELGIYYINTVISLAKKDRNKGDYQHINRQFYTKSLLFCIVTIRRCDRCLYFCG